MYEMVWKKEGGGTVGMVSGQQNNERRKRWWKVLETKGVGDQREEGERMVRNG